MSLNSTNISGFQGYFALSWFLLPIKPEENTQVILVLKDILIITGIILNIVLLWMIWRNPGKKPRNSRALLLANLSIVNLIATIFGLICSIEDKIKSYRICTFKAGAIAISLVLPKYYPSVLLLTLIQYALIVKPLEFKTIDPRKIRTTKIFICIHWIVVTTVMIILPILTDDFNKYLKVIVMLLVLLSWISTTAIAYMCVRTLYTLWKRNDNLRKRFNASATQQGLVVIGQNMRLARTTFFFIVTLFFFTLISNTAYMFLLYCPECDKRVLVKVCFYTIPMFLAVPAMLPINWLIGTPQYWNEVKKQIRKLLVYFGCVGDNQN
ncbi:uncharacterized protein LOC114524787 [Dendronephthya gigantea]|uniref:uncharacterized protein LOC114524787 n=1 Tax=Dendronephthya gigantea TaxID=151771 RepID=UPI00106D8CD5|nr:uncharacterized protein LOC114524787 [Dendronephthya gigantea]XP_028401772.1 uncharacterized protein LOC114524787 [Dendronephthya gigantea]